ncbi:MAG TPA: hypothetical protein VD737_08415 [Steroidobacteraceae bacterium]|nr:hypothetical protein [Steroidobacteraceae bacterium]
MSAEQVVQAYFAGEKAEAFWILLAGLAAGAAAVTLWWWVREPFARGLALALVVVAALGLGVGGTVYFRSDDQARRLVQLHAADPGQFSAEEGPRIAQVVRSFGWYRYAYGVATLLALVLVFAFGRPSHHGVAVGLLLLAALGFTIDFYAERRAIDYQQALTRHGWLAPR